MEKRGGVMTKYLSVLTDMEERIRTGQYVPGHKLPSIRDASEMYGCSKSTIIRAYAELERLHIIYAMPQSGYYVVDRRGEQWDQGKDDDNLDFSSASPDLHIFPYLDFQHCLNRAIDTYQYQLFTYGDSQGLESFRHILVKHLADDQVFAKLYQIVVTSGVQQALNILTRMPFPNGKSVILIEQPSYEIYQRFLEIEGVKVAGIARTTRGLDLDELEKMFKHGDIKFFYTMPRYQNPLGTSYTLTERKAIVRLAERYDVYIVEDDYMGDLGTEIRMNPLYSYDTSEHVIYLKSFSKVVFPGLRIGVAVVPKLLHPTFVQYKIFSDADSSIVSQGALEIYLKNGMFDRHKRKIIQLYASRMNRMNQVLTEVQASEWVDIAPVQQGVYISLVLPKVVNMDQLHTRLQRAGIITVPSTHFFLKDHPPASKFLRLSITRVHEDRIEEGVMAIIEEVKRSGRGWG